MLHSPPPSIALSSVLYNNLTIATLELPSVLYKIEQKWMCQSHGTLHLSCSLIRTLMLPLHLHLSNGMIWNSPKSLLACISTHHRIFFLVLENSSPQLGTFPVPLATNDTYGQAPNNESIPMLVFTIFSKIIDESHAHVY